MSLKRFKNCAVDVNDISYVDSCTLVFETSEKIEAQPGFFDDVLAEFGKLEGSPVARDYRSPSSVRVNWPAKPAESPASKVG